MIPFRLSANGYTKLGRPISTIALRSSVLAGSLRVILPLETSSPTPDVKRFYAARQAETAEPKVKNAPVVPQTKGLEQLTEVLELRYRVQQRKRKQTKADIIAQYPEVRAVIDLIHSPEYKVRLAWPNMLHFITAKRRAPLLESTSSFPAPDDLFEVLKSINTGDLPEHHIKEMFHDYITREQIDMDAPQGRVLKELLHGKFLEGVGPHVLGLVPSPTDPSSQDGDVPAKGNRLTQTNIKKYHSKRAAEAGWGLPGYGTRAYSTARIEYPNPEVIRQLQDLRSLEVRIRGVTRPGEKHAMMKEYPHLKGLLETVYQPDFRTNLSYETFQKFVEKHQNTGGRHSRLPPPATMIELLHMLSRKVVSGDDAKAMVEAFIDNHNIRRTSDSLVQTFGTLLDRKPLPGVSSGTLRSMDWGEGIQGQGGESVDMTAFPVALGKPLEEDPADALNPKYDWYASRKLDGVRCLTTMDIFVPEDGRRNLSLVNLSLASRKNKEFSSLSKLKPQLSRLLKFPKLREYLENDPINVETRDGGVVKRIILDGECCVMVPVSAGPEGERVAAVLTSETGEQEHQSAAAQLWKNDGMIEDFKQTQSQIMKQGVDIQHPRYFLFDLIPGGEFKIVGATTDFSVRNDRLREMVDWLDAQMIKDGIEERMIKRLVQIKVDLSDLDGMYARSAEEGWEGLILRADKPYKGSRSTDIRKYKKFQDAEYVVQGVVTNKMWLSINGKSDDYTAAASITISHDGTDVQVGSGMTPEERVKWAKDPSSIIGKTITVKYFAKSSNQKRPGQNSLRFPIIKHIYEGKRDT